MNTNNPIIDFAKINDDVVIGSNVKIIMPSNLYVKLVIILLLVHLQKFKTTLKSETLQKYNHTHSFAL